MHLSSPEEVAARVARLREIAKETDMDDQLTDQLAALVAKLVSAPDDEYEKFRLTAFQFVSETLGASFEMKPCTCDDISLKRFGGCTCGASDYEEYNLDE